MKRTWIWHHFFAMAFVLVLGHVASAQEQASTTPSGSEFSFHTGPLLPNQIDGMSEIQPVWGLRYGTKLGTSFWEFNLANSRAEGVLYYNAYASYRYDVALEELIGFLYTGLDIHQWSSPPDDTTRVVPGIHVGGGIQMPLGQSMNFRTEMKFNMVPGTALYIGFGLVLKFPEGGGGAQ